MIAMPWIANEKLRIRPVKVSVRGGEALVIFLGRSNRGLTEVTPALPHSASNWAQLALPKTRLQVQIWRLIGCGATPDTCAAERERLLRRSPPLRRREAQAHV